MDAIGLSALTGALLSLAASYIPKLKDRFDALDGTQKRGVMAVALAVVAAVVFLLSCAQVQSFVTCDRAGTWGLVLNLLAALVANQTTYQLSPASSQADKQP